MTRHQRTVAPVALVLLLTAAVGGAAVDAGGGSTFATTSPPGEPIVIGGVGPLSEPGTPQAGIDMQFGMELAVADINEAGGVLGQPLELVFEDTQNLPDVAGAVANRMVEENGAVAVVGEYHSSAALAQIPVYTESMTTFVAVDAWADTITAGDPEDPNLPAQPPSVFRIAPSSTYASGIIADWVVNGLDADKVVQVFEATDFGLSQNEALEAGLEGVTLETAQIELNQPDYAPVLTRLATEHGDADVVIIDVTGESSYVAAQNAIDVGLIDDDTICLTNQVALNAEAFWSAVPDGVGCSFRFIGPVPSAYSELTTSVADRYREEFDQDPPHWMFASYDAVGIVADAIERAGSTDPEAVVAAMEETSFEGTQGVYEFPFNSSNPDVPEDQPWLWHQWPEPAIALLEYTERGQTAADAAIIWPESQQTDGTAYVEVER